MNLAIIVGVSNYLDIKNNLPGCKNDAQIIYDILLKTEKFQQILFINDSETSNQTKDLITNFIAANRSSSINELFFYFSGHGEFMNDEFYYLLSDFDTKKRNQTTIQNREIDDLIKSLSPTLVVKVIDACQSGTTYIKEVNVITKYFTESQKIFNKCYFLSSSLNDQYSYQTEKISLFTASFVKALKVHTTDEIRYKGIIDVILDEFNDNQDQTPFFVIQADLTEKFCSFNESLRNYLNQLSTDENEPSIDSEHKPLSLYDLVKLDAKNYSDKEGALQAVEFIRSTFSTLRLKDGINDLYHLNITFLESYKNIPAKAAIANWLKKNNHDFFVTPKEESYTDYEGEQRSYVTDFDFRLDCPFKVIAIDVLGNFPNLSSYSCEVVFFLSKKEIRFFYFITNLIEINWDEKTINTKDIKWITSDCNIIDKISIGVTIDLIKNKIEERIESDLILKYRTSDDLPF